MHFKKYSQKEENQTKYGSINAVNLTIIFLRGVWKWTTSKCIQYTMKENLLLLKDLLERWKNKIFKHMTAVSKNVYFDVLDNIVKKYNNTVHRSIKMKPIESDSYAEYT